MRKLVGGCLVVVVLGVVALGVAGYMGYRAARPVIDGATDWAGQAGELAALSDHLHNTAPFDPPATGELTEGQVRRFMAVHDRVRTTLGARFAERRSGESAPGASGPSEVAARAWATIRGLVSGVGGSLIDARRALIEAMNAEGFSAAEYSWVRLRVYEAAGIETVRAIDWSAAEAMLQKGAEQTGLPAPSMSLPEIPERNRELVLPHVEALREWLPLAALGV